MHACMLESRESITTGGKVSERTVIHDYYCLIIRLIIVQSYMIITV